MGTLPKYLIRIYEIQIYLVLNRVSVVFKENGGSFSLVLFCLFANFVKLDVVDQSEGKKQKKQKKTVQKKPKKTERLYQVGILLFMHLTKTHLRGGI
jgi:hypothetical protein